LKKFNVAIVGATGVVGQEMRSILSRRDFPIGRLKLLASADSAGKKLDWRGSDLIVETLSAAALEGTDIALFSAGSDVSLRYAPIARDMGAVVIDNSSAWRMQQGIPLVVPEVNSGALSTHQGIIANPNCSTIQMVVALKPLHDRWSIKRVVVTTYQAVSGAGHRAIEELLSQTRAQLAGQKLESAVFPHPISFNLLPHIDVFQMNGYSKEENKMIEETRKILDLPDLRITATAVRVPVVVGHSESINVEFFESVTVDEARRLFELAPGIKLVDEPDRAEYPMPLTVAGTDDCYVGRVRVDESVESGLNFWLVADNLRKGAALNAVQIAERLVAESYL
jgi:aspartate-semialdehyde dehydrogenase